MKTLATFLFLISTSSTLSAFDNDQLGQNLLSSQTKKLMSEMQKELDLILDKYEGKLDDQLARYEEKMDSQIDRMDAKFKLIEESLDEQASKAEKRMDATFQKVDNEMGDVKTTMLETVGTIAWRLTIVDIITALVGTFATAFITAFIISKKIHLDKMREEMGLVVAETKKSIEELQKSMNK